MQIADALTAAHQKQITHRDLKPGNVMLTHDGRVKVLDFGLARVGETDAAELSLAATLAPITHQGMLVGTMPYMSPEQVEGKTPDPRSDLFSLGVIFYEMLSGERPFKGSSSPALMSAILRDTPPGICDVRTDVPDALGRLISRCIEKRPEDRVQTARDVFNELRHLQKPLDGGSRASSSAMRRAAPVVAENMWVAVLPFTVRGIDPDGEAIAAGLTEDITASLAKFSSLSVVASQSTRGFKDSPLDIRQIAERLGARYIVSGMVRKAGPAIRTAAQVVDAQSGAQLWSETYDRTIGENDLFAIQDDLTDHIVASVADPVGVLARSMMRAVRQNLPATELTSRELLLKASGHQHKPTPADHLELRAALESRLRTEPDNAHLWGELAHFYLDEHILALNPQPDPLGRALAAARRAIELDPNNQRGWGEQAAAYFFLRNRAGLVESAERAIRINPRNALNMAWMGNLLTHAGEYDRGAALSQRAITINPAHPGWAHFGVFNRHLAAGDYAEALNSARRVNMPQLNWMHLAIAAAASHLGLMDEARRAYQAAIAITPAFTDPAVLRDYIERWYWDEALVEAQLAGIASARDDSRTSSSDAVPSAVKPPSGAGAARGTRATWVAVLPFQARSNDEDSRTLADALTEDITTALSRFGYLRVLSRAAAERLAAVTSSPSTPAPQPHPRFVLEGAVRKAGGTLRVGVRIIDTQSGANLWAENFDREAAAGTFSLQDELTARIAATIGDNTGVLSKALAVTLVDAPLEQLAIEELGIRYHAYGEHLRREEHARLREALERFVEREPSSAAAWALLSRLYEHEHSQGLNPLPDSVERQRRSAERAVELDPRHQQAWTSLASARFFSRDLPGLRASIERALAINPLNADHVAFCALLLSAAGDDDQALTLVRRAMTNKPQHPGWYHFITFTGYYRRGAWEEALTEGKRINMPMLPSSHFAVAAAAGQLRRAVDARIALDALRAISPVLVDPSRARQTWAVWSWDERLVQPFVDGFEAALAIAGDSGTLTSSASRPAPSLRAGLAVIVRTFAATGAEPAPTVAEALAADIATGLARFRDVRVATRATGQTDSSAGAAYAIEGEVRASAASCRISARLIDVSAGVQVWSETYTRDAATDPFVIVDDVASHVVAAVADGYGALLRAFAATVSDRIDLAQLGLLKRLFALPQDLDPVLHGQLRDDVGALLERDPQNARLWSVQAFLGALEMLYDLNVGPDASERTRRAAERSMALDSSDQASWSARAMVAFLDRDLTRLRSAAERAIEINPLHSLTLAMAGSLLVHAGEVDRGTALVRRAMELNPNHPGWYHAALALAAVGEGDADAAFTHMSRNTIGAAGTFKVFYIATAGHFGRSAEAAIADLSKLRPELLDPARAGAELAKWIWDGQLLDCMIDGFQKAIAKRSTATPESLAVLPFADLSPVQDQEWFCDGIAEEILNALSRVPGLHVAARASAFSFRGRSGDLRTIARELNVATVLEGSVRRAGDRVRITAQLSDAREGRQLWSERFDRELVDIFEVQDEIARAIVDRLKISLSPRNEPLVAKSTSSIEAYELLLKGRVLLNRRGGAIIDAMRCFEQAVAIDPQLSEAHALLGDAHRLKGLYGLAPPSEAMPPARAAVERALALDANQVEAWATLANIAFIYDWDLDAWRTASDRALSIDPSHIRTLGERSIVLCAVPAPETAMVDGTLEHIDTALAIDPLNSWLMAVKTLCLVAVGRTKEAVVVAELAVATDANNFAAQWALVGALTLDGRDAEAKQIALATALPMSGRNSRVLAELAAIHARLGEQDAARAIFVELERRAQNAYIGFAERAAAAAAAGEPVQALALIVQAIAGRDTYLLFWKHAAWQPFWSDPACAAALRKTALLQIAS
jgi:TolB-like protein/Tfp pilus assembly protein PilF